MIILGDDKSIGIANQLECVAAQVYMERVRLRRYWLNIRIYYSSYF